STMKKKLITTAVAATAALGLFAGPAAAAPDKPDTDCLRAGQAVLRTVASIDAAARQEINYAAFDETGAGLIRTELGDEAYLPINEVFQLHLRSPELFAWCD
ncbi:MAG: hypothetical protein R3320_04380, partial [Nitriliruptorales bacterium]|nr:hypothetical protein [Nitriliruptorales bacterium]